MVSKVPPLINAKDIIIAAIFAPSLTDPWIIGSAAMHTLGFLILRLKQLRKIKYEMDNPYDIDNPEYNFDPNQGRYSNLSEIPPETPTERWFPRVFIASVIIIVLAYILYVFG